MDDKLNHKILQLREIMKAYTAFDEEDISDQNAGLAQPPLEKAAYGKKTIDLTTDFKDVIKNNNFLDIITNRKSRRKYEDAKLTLGELSFLLWSTQGVKKVIGRERKATIRMVPSAGARHPFETYLFVKNVEGLEPGLYHYLAIEHKLELVQEIKEMEEKLSKAFLGQEFFGYAPVSFVWTVTPYRTEWRYTTKAQKYALIDIGHVCQNLYLACEAIGCGTCAIGAYDQELADELIELDTTPSFSQENEFVVYAASVGKVIDHD